MDYKSYKDSLSEAVEVLKTLEVVQAQSEVCYRIEVVRHAFRTAHEFFTVHFYRRVETGVWVRSLSFPSVRQPTADLALKEGLDHVAYPR